MSIKEAVLSDLGIVKRISEITISEIYPHYYPKGAVEDTIVKPILLLILN